MYKENDFQKEGPQSSWKWDHLRDEVSPFPSPSLPWPASNLSKSVFPSLSPPPSPWAVWFFYVNILADLRTVLLIHLIVTNNGSVSPANYFTSLTDACLSCTFREKESSAHMSNNNNLVKNLMHSHFFPSTGFALWMFKRKEKKEKDSPISLKGHSMQYINEENHWRSLWQKRRMSQTKAGPPVDQPPVWGGGGGGGGWKGERRDGISSLTLLELGGTGCRSKAGDKTRVHIKSLNSDQVSLQRISNFYLLYVFTIFNLTVKCPALLRASQLRSVLK